MKRVLYLGLMLPKLEPQVEFIHYPLIHTSIRNAQSSDIIEAFKHFKSYTHLVITSKTSLPILFEYAKIFGIPHSLIIQKQLLAVGQATANAAMHYGLKGIIPDKEQSSEGMVAMMKQLDLSTAYLFWPHSAISRQILPNFFRESAIRFQECVFYDTLPNRSLPKPDLENIDEIIFTSPSTVDAFLELWGPIPWHKQIKPIGPITATYLRKFSVGH